MKISAHVLGLALLLGWPQIAMAEEKVTILDCGDRGCRCQLGSVTANEAAIVVGIDPPPTPDSVLVSFDGTYRWSRESPDSLDMVMGGDGKCELELFDEMKPEDGLWVSKGRVNSLTCGSGTAMMRGVLEKNLHGTKPVRVAWNGVFDAATFYTAWQAANPDPEAVNPKWNRKGPYKLSGSESHEGLTHRYDMELLTPTLFRLNWQVDARMEEGPCRWSVTQTVRWVSK